MIVFDSYDLTGKTPLAERLSKDFNIPLPTIFKGQKPEFLDPLVHAFWSKAQYYMLARILNGGVKVNMIMDRWIMTEYCYSPILRGYKIDDYYFDIENKIYDKDIIWIYPFSTDDVIINRYKKGKEKFISIQDLFKVKNNYEKLLQNTKLKVIQIDTSNLENEFEIIYKNLVETLKKTGGLNEGFNYK